jgi:hemerythrin-like domain-containing protein
MNSTKILKDEHRLIEKVIGALEKMVSSTKEGADFDLERLKKILQFSKTFVDWCHHGKEEDCLFPCLEKRGVPREGGPIGIMLEEHEQGRALVRQMGEHIDQIESGQSAEFPDNHLISLCDEYVQLLQQHIYKEDNILFNLADQSLTEEDEKEILKDYDQVEMEKVGAGVHDEMHKLSEEILH